MQALSVEGLFGPPFERPLVTPRHLRAPRGLARSLYVSRDQLGLAGSNPLRYTGSLPVRKNEAPRLT